MPQRFNSEVMTTFQKNIRQNAQILKSWFSVSNFGSRSFWWSLGNYAMVTISHLYFANFV